MPPEEERRGRALYSGMAASLYRLRYVFDYGGGCLWGDNEAAKDRFGYAIDPIALPLSPETVAHIAQVSAWYDTSLNWEYPPDPGPWRQEECARFTMAARTLHTDIARALGLTFVVRDEQSPVRENPDLDAYLRDPAHFWRTP